MQRSARIPNRTLLNKRSRAHACTSHLVTVPTGPVQATACSLLGRVPVIRVEPWCESNTLKKLLSEFVVRGVGGIGTTCTDAAMKSLCMCGLFRYSYLAKHWYH